MRRLQVLFLTALMVALATATVVDNTTAAVTSRPTDPPRTNATSGTAGTTTQTTASPQSNPNQTPALTSKPTDPPRTNATSSNTSSGATTNPIQTPAATVQPTDPPRTSTLQTTMPPQQPPTPTSFASVKPTDLPRTNASSPDQTTGAVKPTDLPRTNATNPDQTSKPTDPPRVTNSSLPTNPPRTDMPKTDLPPTQSMPPRTDATANRTDIANRTDLPRTDAISNRTDVPKTDLPRTNMPANRTDLPKTDFPTNRTDRTDLPRTDLPLPTAPRTAEPGDNNTKTDRPRTAEPGDNNTKTDRPRTVEPGDNNTKTEKPSDRVITTTGMIRVSGDGWANMILPTSGVSNEVRAAALVSTATFLGVPTSAVVVTSLSVGSLIISYNVTGNVSTLMNAYQNSVATATSANTAWMRSLTEVYTKANPNSAPLMLLNSTLVRPSSIPDGPMTLTPFSTRAPRTEDPSNDTRSDRPSTSVQPPPNKTRTDQPFTPRTDIAPPRTLPPFTRPPCTPNLTLAVNGAVFTFPTSQVVRVYAGLSDGALCGFTPSITWSVGTLAAVQGSAFTAAAGALAAGTYQGSVSISANAGVVSAQAAFTIVIVAPPATIQIRGGERQVSVGSSISFVAAATRAKTVTWSCCQVNDGACAAATCSFSASMLDSSFVGTLATGFPSAGKFVVTATSDAGVSATVKVAVVSSTQAVNNVQLQTSASSTVYVGRPIVVVAQAADGSQYAWSATDGTTKNGGSVATFKPTAAGTFNVTVTATSKSNVVGTASLSFTILALPTGTLTVTSTDSPIVGGTSPLVFTLSQWTGPSTATFRFGYLQYGEWNSLSDDFSTATSQTYTAPLVLADRSIIFAAQAKMGDIRLDPITFTLALSAPANKTAAIADRQKVMQDAAAAKDISTVLRAAKDVADASNSTSASSTSGSSAAADSSAAATSAVAAVASVVTSTMSSTQKGAAVDVLATAVTDSGKKVDADTQKKVAKALKAVLANASTSAASSSDAVDTTTRAAAMLALISSVNATAMANDSSNRDSRQQLARDLAMAVAAQLPVGQTSNVKNGDMNITAVKLPVSAAQPTGVVTSAGSISIPLDALASAMKANPAVVAQSGTNVAVSATSHTSNPVPSATAPTGTKISSAIVEFDATASGANFSSLATPITIRLQANATADGKRPTCVYFDASTNSWSTAGVVTTDYNAADQTVGCNTTHLSMFAAAAAVSLIGPSPPSGSSGTNSTSSSDNAALYAGIGVGVGVLLIAGVVIVRRRQMESTRHAAPGEHLEPLNEAHQRQQAQLQVPMAQRSPYDPYNAYSTNPRANPL